VRLPAKRRADAIAIPPLAGEETFSPSTRAWWRTVWSSPMAGQYLDVDVVPLTRLAVLVDRASRGELPERVLGEMRLLEDRFGLNAVSRRRLGWEVGTDRGDVAASSAGEDEARWLRAVSD
jgi:hypothetical protein